MSRYLKIEWRNSTDLGEVYYNGGFTGKMLLDVEVERPEYPVEIESDLNGDNQEIPKFRKWSKEYKFKVWGTEDLVDAFTFMQIHDTINITLQTGQQIVVDKMTVEIDWENIGCLAEMTVSFIESYVVATGCDDNMDDSCICDSYEEFIKIIDTNDPEYLDPDNNGVVVGDRFLFHYLGVGSEVAGWTFVGAIYEYAGGNHWNLLAQSLNQCEHNLDTGNDWVEVIFGTPAPISQWVRSPGAIASITQPGANQILISGFAIPGFIDVYIDDGGGYVLDGTYTNDQFLTGITLSVAAPGNYDVKINVRTHGCTYGDSNVASILLT